MKSNEGQLVCQYLENISHDALKKYQAVIREFVKGRHGVYALYRKDHLYYVGLASNLRNRLKTHLKDRHARTWDKFSVYLVIEDSHLRELETIILRIAAPKGNKQSGKFANADDLRPVFRRNIAEVQQRELDSILGNTKEKLPAQELATTIATRKPILAPYTKSKRFELRLRYKGKLYKARVRKNGSISCLGSIYNSPSLAASAIKKRATNGWTNWKYERAPGDWVLLDTLRKK
jgi:hypothetical protein